MIPQSFCYFSVYNLSVGQEESAKTLSLKEKQNKSALNWARQ